MSGPGRYRVFAAIAMLCQMSSADAGSPPSANVAPLSICYAAPFGTLVAVAAAQGEFKKQGLDVRLRSYASSLDALNGLFSGECASVVR